MHTRTHCSGQFKITKVIELIEVMGPVILVKVLFKKKKKQR